MNCETCTYRYECASADVYPATIECGAQAEVIDINEYRRAKKDESIEDRLFGTIDKVFDAIWPWVIGATVIYLAYHLLRWWLHA